MIRPNYDELVQLKKSVARAGFQGRTRAVTQMFGGQKSLFKGRGLDFSEYREYAAEDDVRAIDWRVTARTDRPHSKVFREERERSVYIVVDLSSRMRFGTRKTFKSVQAARAAALIAWTANRAHDKVGAVVFGQVEGGSKILKAKSSRLGIWTLFKTLCAPPVAGAPEGSLGTALKNATAAIPRGASVFIISDFAESGAEFERAVERLGQNRDLTLIQVGDPADRRIPPVGEIKFFDSAGAAVKIDTLSAAGAKKYSELWEQNQRLVERSALKARAKLIQISTEGDVTNILAKELRGRQ